MAISKSTNTYNRQNWEDSEFPILCQTCLGDNPYIRMIKDKYSEECKICERPFTTFRWCPGKGMRYKKTEVCQTCAQLKNVCQTCLFDLQYGLPVQVRDKLSKINDNLPKSDVNKEFYRENIEKQLQVTGRTEPAGAVGKAQPPSDLLMKLSRTSPYYKRNRPHICSFWVKGECRRGEECPFRHEMPTDPTDPLASQNLRDRYYGVNDPVADKIFKQVDSLPELDIPDDRSVTTLYIGGLEDVVTEQDLRDHFYQFGEIRSVHVVQKQNCAFVTFSQREAAEAAAEGSYGKLIIKGKKLKVMWGKPQGAIPTPSLGSTTELTPVPGLPPAALPPPPLDPQADVFGIRRQSKGDSEDKDDKSRDIPSSSSSDPSEASQSVAPPPPFMFPPAPLFPPPHMMGMPPPPGMFPPQGGAPPMNRAPPTGVHYPSQDPQRMGAKAPKIPN